MKKFYLFLLLFSIFFFPIKTFALVQKSDVKYVTDEAKLLTNDAEEYIVQYSEFIYKMKKIDYYVVTVKDLDDLSIEEYSDEIFRSFKIRDRGLLILVSKDDRRIRIQAGSKLADIVSKTLIDQYIDTYFMPYLERDEWNDGIVNGYSAFYKYLCEKYDIDASSMEVVDTLDFVTKYRTPLVIFIMWGCAMFSTFYAKSIRKNNSKNKHIIRWTDYCILGIIIILNICCLSFAYILKPVYLLFGIFFQGVIMYSNLNASPEKIRSRDYASQKQKKHIHKSRKKR